MEDARIRRQIALLAARLMYDRQESEYFTAKRKAARQLGVEYRHRPKDLPSNREIRRCAQFKRRWNTFACSKGLTNDPPTEAGARLPRPRSGYRP